MKTSSTFCNFSQITNLIFLATYFKIKGCKYYSFSFQMETNWIYKKDNWKLELFKNKNKNTPS